MNSKQTFLDTKNNFLQKHIHFLSFWHDTVESMVKSWYRAWPITAWQKIGTDLWLNSLGRSYSSESIHPDGEYWQSYLNMELEIFDNLPHVNDPKIIDTIRANSNITLFEKVAMLREMQISSMLSFSEKKVDDILG